MESLEERIAHLERQSDELSDIVAAQAAEIARLQRHVMLLMDQAAERELESQSVVTIADKPPPHW